ncbi:MAG: TonB-dependent receptor [Bacteroidota bacterium]|nr:TonB-dependent receptor [Candidatus Kapabacteria bacterium]MDW8220822.1 TonB-dependent receptor [Bacteroidota bacterium]
MKSTLFIFALVSVAALHTTPHSLCSQTRLLSSSRATLQVQNVDVLSSRVTAGSERIAAPSSVLDASTIRTIGARQVADALTFVPGVFVRNYGGVGGLKTVSLRGASASQTAIILDGVRINSTQNGQFDCSMFPASLLEEIEVIRGGGAAIFGGNAIGGAINMRIRSHVYEPEVSAAAEVASFEEFRAYATAALPFDIFTHSRGSILAGADIQTARGNYPFPFDAFGQRIILERTNADAQNLSAHLTTTIQSQRFSLQTRMLARFSERGTPGAVVQGNIEMAQARLGEHDMLLSAQASYIPTDKVVVTALAMSKFNTIHYRDPEARQFGVNGIDERFVAHDFSFNARMHFEETLRLPAWSVAHEWLLEHQRSSLRGNMLQRDVGTFVERLTFALSGKGDIRWRLSDPEQSSTHVLVGTPALRFDYFSDMGVALSPLLSVAYMLDSTWTLRTEWSWNFRPPSFNELYYFNFGNSRLQPERAHCWNIGSTWAGSTTIFGELIYGTLRTNTSVDIFLHRTHNLILAVPTTPFTISAQNIAEAQSYGIEARFHAALENHATCTLNYTYQRTTNETLLSFARGRILIYTPEHLASLLCTVRLPISEHTHIQVGCTAQYVGERFFLPSNTPESLLPAFFTAGTFCDVLHNLRIGEITARLHIDNLFDEYYAIIRNFPMPGRAIRFTLGIRML